MNPHDNGPRKDESGKSSTDLIAEKYRLREEIKVLREALEKYPCICRTSFEDVKELYPNLKCHRCAALSHPSKREEKTEPEFPEAEVLNEAIEQMKLGVAIDSAYIRGARFGWNRRGQVKG
jgi:hypothetical protein